jgi:hypothetical protein
MLAQQSAPVLQNGSVRYPTPMLTRTEQQLRVLELTVELLIARASLGDCWVYGFQNAAELLDAAPFPFGDHASALRHLQNALAYCRQHEFGAAAFELRSLRGLLMRI